MLLLSFYSFSQNGPYLYQVVTNYCWNYEGFQDRQRPQRVYREISPFTLHFVGSLSGGADWINEKGTYLRGQYEPLSEDTHIYAGYIFYNYITYNYAQTCTNGVEYMGNCYQGRYLVNTDSAHYAQYLYATEQCVVPTTPGTAITTMYICPAGGFRILSSSMQVPYNEQVVLYAKDTGYFEQDYIWQYSTDFAENYHDFLSGKSISFNINDIPNAAVGQDIYLRLKQCRGTGTAPITVTFEPIFPELELSQYQAFSDCYSNPPAPVTLRLERELNGNESVTDVYLFQSENNGMVTGRINVPFVRNGRDITLQFNSPVPNFNYYIMVEGACSNIPMMSKSSRLQITNPAPYAISVNTIQPTCHYTNGEIAIQLQNPSAGNKMLNKYLSTDGIHFQQILGNDLRGFFDDIVKADIYPIRGLSAGNYFVYLADNNDCRSNVANVSITTPPALSVNFSTTNVSGIQYINGVPDTVSDASVNINFVQNDGNGYQVLTPTQNLPIGAGKLVIAYNSGQCKDTFDFNIGLNPVKLQVEIREVAGVSCYALNDAVLSPVIVQDSYLSKSYKWYKLQNGNFVLVGTNENLTNVAAGTYRLECYSGGLRAVFDYNVAQPTRLNAVASMIFDPSCHNYEDGKIAVKTSGGTSPYSLLWNTGETSDTIRNLPAGLYKCWTTDALGCKDSVMVSLINFPPVTVDVSTSIALCDAPVGRIVLTAHGGVQDYVYYWDGKLGNFMLRNAAGGVYHYEVKDGHGCSVTGNVDIRDTNIVEISNVIVHQPDYVGSMYGEFTTVEPNGEIAVFPSKGLPPYQYQWSNGATTQHISGLSDGIYTVTVTDAHYCSATRSFLIEKYKPFITEIKAENVSCYGLADGNVQAQVQGGKPPYRYSWSTSDTSAVVEGLPEGSYYLTVKDANNVISLASISITQPAPLVGEMFVWQPNCFGENDGFARIEVSGGNGGYQYLWSSGEITNYANNLAEGNYYVMVHDSKNCSITDSVKIVFPEKLTASFRSKNLSYTGSQYGEIAELDPDGEIEMLATGGTGQLRYFINNQQVAALTDSLDTGTYVAFVYDQHKCFVTDTIILIKPNNLISELSVLQHVMCYGGEDGELETIADGGTPPYNYYLNSVPTNFVPNRKFSAKKYIFEVEDALGIRSVDSITIHQPDVISVNFSIDSVTGCDRYDGKILPMVSGGVEPYTYVWLNKGNVISTEAVLDSIPAGVYHLQLTDANNCFSEYYVVMNNPDPMMITAIVRNVSYVGSIQGIDNPVVNDGRISVFVEGGFPPYRYMWSHSATTPVVDNLAVGTYSLEVTDVNNNVSYAVFNISKAENMILTVEQTAEILCYGDNTASLISGISGGTAPFRYDWTPNLGTTTTTTTLSDLASGMYNLTVTDALGIASSYQIEIRQPDLLAVNSQKTDVSCFGSNDGNIVLDISGGTGNYNIEWSVGSNHSTSLQHITEGIYGFWVTDDNGCTATNTIEIYKPADVRFTLSEKEFTLCNGQTARVSASNPDNSYLWQHPSGWVYEGQNVALSDAGQYVVTAYNSDNCMMKDTVKIIRKNDEISVSIWASSEVAAGIPYIAANAESPNHDAAVWNIKALDNNENNCDISLQNKNYLNAIFSQSGNYEIYLTAYHNGCMAMDTALVTVYPSDSLLVLRSSAKVVKNLQVVPNPVNDVLNFSCYTDNQTDVRWQLISSETGKVVLSGNISAFGDTKYTIDVETVVAGTYVLLLLAEGQNETAIVVII
ncbi:hypothetical protein FACS1894178_4380 [Bacteroidia bacterium]|nr:hypothetical protein FACS1894178_4380 [Bacteroidia bacterium]